MSRQEQQIPDLGQMEAVILGVLLSSPGSEMYGLEILAASAGLLKRGSLYVTLQRMEEKKLVESRQEVRPKPEVGIPRRLYSVTGLGDKAFERYRSTHQKLHELFATA
jgi:PadR family transcriptional regulator PadR